MNKFVMLDCYDQVDLQGSITIRTFPFFKKGMINIVLFLSI